MYGMKKDQLQLLPHDPAWKNDFLTEKNRIAVALSDQSVLIEHVGSTAIPTIHAKPIIDIAILCSRKWLESLAQAFLGSAMIIGGSSVKSAATTMPSLIGTMSVSARPTYLRRRLQIGMQS